MSVKIICPYVNDNEINQLKNKLWNLPVYFEKDHARIGSDMMYQKLWNKFSNDDIFIMHSDMFPAAEDEDNEWFDKVLKYVEDPNDADERIDKLESIVFQQGRLIEMILKEKPCKSKGKKNV